jgi:catechol 2,3-dioxygenase-like lactoylglutathione lyase family enzyme
MLKDAAIVPYIPVADVARARRFYEDKVGLTPKEEYAGGVIYECGNGFWVFTYPSAGAGTSKASTHSGPDAGRPRLSPRPSRFHMRCHRSDSVSSSSCASQRMARRQPATAHTHPARVWLDCQTTRTRRGRHRWHGWHGRYRTTGKRMARRQPTPVHAHPV